MEKIKNKNNGCENEWLAYFFWHKLMKISWKEIVSKSQTTGFHKLSINTLNEIINKLTECFSLFCFDHPITTPLMQKIFAYDVLPLNITDLKIYLPSFDTFVIRRFIKSNFLCVTKFCCYTSQTKYTLILFTYK